jgi:hypothetical protein
MSRMAAPHITDWQLISFITLPSSFSFMLFGAQYGMKVMQRWD